MKNKSKIKAPKKPLNKGDVKRSATALTDVQSALEEIRKFKDLRKFQLEKTDEFCKKYDIKSGQLNFLISVVGAERAKENGVLA
jgi:hypothetical protein